MSDRTTTLRPDDFLTYDELLEKLPKPMDREAIRKLCREHGLPVHRIGVHTMFLGAEIFAASAGSSDVMPILTRGCVYTREQLIKKLHIGQRTFSKWIAEGLRGSKRHTKVAYFLSDDVIDFLFGESSNE